MKKLMRLLRWKCKDCGRMAWEARVPEGVDEAAYAPTKCGYCRGSSFTCEERGRAA